MIKVLYLPLNAGSNIQNGMYDAWRDLPYVELKIFDFYKMYESSKNKDLINKNFIETVEEFQPDLVAMQLQMTNVIYPNSIATAKLKTNNKCIFTNWSGDVRNHASKEMINISKVVDYTLISSTGQVDLYKSSGAKNVHYWQIGYDHNKFYPLNKNIFKYDLVFAGNAYTNTFADARKRLDMILQLKKHFKEKFGIFGGGYSKEFGEEINSIDFNDLNSLYSQSRCILSISNYNDISHYFSDRLLICMSSGRPTISYRFPEYESYFSDNCDILIGRSVSEIIQKVEYCKNNPEVADKIGKNGANKVNAEHTYKSRVIELLKLVGLR